MKEIQKIKRRLTKNFLISLGIISIFIAIGYSPYGKQIFTSVGFISAALVFALQNFVSSFVAYLFISFSNTFKVGDIIKTGSPFMPAIGQVLHIGLFYTVVKETDDKLLFTGKTVSFPNNTILTNGVFNYTRNNLLFWHEIIVRLKGGASFEQDFSNLESIVHDIYFSSLEDPIYNERDEGLINKPKITISIDKGIIVCSIRCLVHFYRVIDFNNKLISKINAAHLVNHIHLDTGEDASTS